MTFRFALHLRRSVIYLLGSSAANCAAFIALAVCFLLVGCSQVVWNNPSGLSYYATSFLEMKGGTMVILRSTDGKHFTQVGFYRDAPLADPFSLQIEGKWWLVYSESYNHLYPAHTFGIARSEDEGNTYVKQQSYEPAVENSCYEVGTPKFVTNADGTPYIDQEGYHLLFECFAEQSFEKISFYEIHSKDLATWSEPATRIVTNGLPEAMQNPVVLLVDGIFYLWYKNEAGWTIEYARGDRLTGPYSPVKRGDWAGWGNRWDSEALVKTGAHTWIIYLTDPMSYSISIDDWRTWTRPTRVHPNGLRNGNVTASH